MPEAPRFFSQASGGIAVLLLFVPQVKPSLVSLEVCKTGLYVAQNHHVLQDHCPLHLPSDFKRQPRLFGSQVDPSLKCAAVDVLEYEVYLGAAIGQLLDLLYAAQYLNWAFLNLAPNIHGNHLSGRLLCGNFHAKANNFIIA